MRILIFIEYVIVGHWRRDAWSVAVARGLSGLGHDVIVACDGAHDLAAFAPAEVIARKPLRTRFGGQPLRFQAWAEKIRDTTTHDVSLSLTPLVPAVVTLTAIDNALGRFSVILSMRNPVSMMLEYLHEPLLPLVAIAERRVVRSPLIQRRLVLAGAPPGARVGDDVSIGMASTQEPVTGDARESLRTGVRSSLGIDSEACVLLTSAMHPFRAGATAMVEGFAAARDRAVVPMGSEASISSRDAPPVLLVAGRYNVAFHNAAAKAGCLDRVKFLGGTSRMEAALAAADVAIVPAPLRPLTGTGRFIADAVRVGLPVVASPGAPGVHLLTRVASGVLSPGIVVGDNTPQAWRAAIEMILDSGVRARHVAAARDMSPVLTMSSLLARLEHVLMEQAARGTGRRVKSSDGGG